MYPVNTNILIGLFSIESENNSKIINIIRLFGRDKGDELLKMIVPFIE